MNGKHLLELKKKYDGIAYLPFKDTEIGDKKIYFRAPTVKEYVESTRSDVAEPDKYKCIQNCVFAITNEIDETVEIDPILEYIQTGSPGFINQLFTNIIALSPLSSKDKTIELYKAAKEDQSLLLNSLKLDLLITFNDFNLAEAFDNFSYAKFIEYLVMLEKTKNTQGLFMAELLDAPELMEPHVKEAVDKITKQQKNPKQQKPKFPKNLANVDPRNTDPAVQSAITAAQAALNAQMARDRAGIKTTVDFDAENAEHNDNFGK